MITGLQIRNYLGIRAASYTFGPAGVIFEGDNGKNKTGTIKAIRAALHARDVGPDAIHKGADEAEIVLDLDHETVRRLITSTGTRLKVTLDNGPSPSAPQKFLNELLGASALDPIELIEGDPKERYARILRALPVVVTPDVLGSWLPAGETISAAECEGHGLVVLERVRKGVYDRRTEAARALKGAEEDARIAATRVATAEGVIAEAFPEKPADARPLAAIDADGKANGEELATARGRAAAAREQSAQADATRTRIADLRAQAAKARAESVGPALGSIDAEHERIADKRAEIAAVDLEIRELQEKRGRIVEALAVHEATLEELSTQQAIAESATQRAADLGARADELAATMPAVAEDLSDAIAKLQAREAELRAEYKHAVLVGDVAAARVKLDAAKAAAAAKSAEHERLDASVRALQNEAPRTLLAACGAGLEGLEIDGSSIKVDGVAIDMLCGQELLTFSVELARRLNKKSRILVVDRLEALSPTKLDAFVQHATRDGYQLIATRVGVGELRAVPIERSGEA